MSLIWSATARPCFSAPFGRFYQFLIQATPIRSPTFHSRAPTRCCWNGSAFEQGLRVDPAANNLQPGTNSTRPTCDELTLGFEQQIGNTIGVGIRGVFRQWNDMIDDIITFDAEGGQFTEFVDLDYAEREYMGVEFVFDKRFSDRSERRRQLHLFPARGTTSAATERPSVVTSTPCASTPPTPPSATADGSLLRSSGSER